MPSSPDPADPAGHAYVGAIGRTRSEARTWACRCGERFALELVRSIDASVDRHLVRRLLDGSLNRARCVRCGCNEPVGVTVVLHDPHRRRLILLVPDSMRHRELEERGRLFLRLAADGAPAPRYVREPRVALGLDELRDLWGAVGHEDGELAGLEPAGAGAEPGAPPAADAAVPVPLLEDATPLPPPRRAPSDDEATRARLAIPDARSSVIERWAAHREPPTTLVSEDEVLHLVALPRGESAPFVEGPLELRVQLHRMPSYPLVVITLASAPVGGGRPRALHAVLELGRAAHRAVLDRLAGRAAVTLLLFTPEYLPLARREVTAPLSQNVTLLYASAREALRRIPSGQRDFEAARRAFLATDYDRLGRVEPELAVARGPLDDPGAVRRAVAEVQRWSEAGAEAYLTEIRSLPVTEWGRLREVVVRRALELGLHTRRALVERVLKEARVAAAWPEVVRRQLAAFAALTAERRLGTLTPDEVTENWRLLLGEAKAAGIQVDPELQGRGTPPSAPHPSTAGVPSPAAEEITGEVASPDLGRASVAELTALLDRREARRAAALALCGRRDPSALEPLFQALARMTRAEVNRVLPAVVAAFGDACVPRLVEGLRSRRSYLRQGCALGLGMLGDSRAIEPLLALLRSEPTEVWREVARAVGDLGPAAAPAIGQRLRTSDAQEVRERLVRALAHLAVRAGAEAVERLAASREEPVAEAARCALELSGEVRRAEREVRVEAPRDQTVVRAFSRRFFEALGEDAELADLDPRDVVADEPEEEEEEAETLDEADLLEEPVVARPDRTEPRLNLPPDRTT